LGDPATVSFARVARMLRDCLPHVPAPVFRRRFELASDPGIHALAVHKAASRRGRGNVPHIERMIEDLVDALSGLLSAPSRRAAEYADDKTTSDV